MSHSAALILIGIAIGIVIDGLIFDWPFRRRERAGRRDGGRR